MRSTDAGMANWALGQLRRLAEGGKLGTKRTAQIGDLVRFPCHVGLSSPVFLVCSDCSA
ncbi:MAG: hypothetical protein ABIZ05_00155 [Pseudonocardiaceae bacterium]